MKERVAYTTPIPQSGAINSLHWMTTLKDRSIEKKKFSDVAILRSEKDDTELVIEDFEHFQWVSSTKKLFAAIRQDFYIRHCQDIRIPITNYAELCQKHCIKELRSQLRLDLGSLLQLKAPIGGSKIPEPLFLEAGLERGYIYVRLAPLFMKEMNQMRGPIQLPFLFFELNTRKYRYAADMLYYIAVMRFLNNANGKRRDHITVASLLEVTALPTLEEVHKTGNKSKRERIYDPFFENLHALESELTFELVNALGFPITEEEAKRLNYYDFQKVCIHFCWVHEKELRKP